MQAGHWLMIRRMTQFPGHQLVPLTPEPLTCQRDLFSIPAGHCYLNSAFMGPLPRLVEQAGIAALGARASDLLRLVLSKGLALTAVGFVLGLLAALQATRLLGYLLYRVSPRDPVAFASAFAVLVVASFVACAVPAWRATRTDPLRALRG